MFKQKPQPKSPADISRICYKHRELAKRYNEIKSFTVKAGELILVHEFCEITVQKNIEHYYLVKKDFNYYLASQENFLDGHIAYDDTHMLRPFIGRSITRQTKFDVKGKTPTRVIHLTNHFYGQMCKDAFPAY